MTGAVAAVLEDGRLHLQHGPIDLLIGVDAAPGVVRSAHEVAAGRFPDILPALVAELPALRRPVGEAHPLFAGPVARRMARAVWAHRDVFVTPMAAVAGAVADEMLAEILSAGPVARAHVNNGGDIALYLAPGRRYRAGLVADHDRPAIAGFAAIAAGEGIGGIATSGWRGRSRSLGIADAVTVLAADAAAADAAATLIANAVDVDHPAVARRPARELDPDSDLGELRVTVAVGNLPRTAVDAAVAAGMRRAMDILDRGCMIGAAIALAGRFETVGRRAGQALLRGYA